MKKLTLVIILICCSNCSKYQKEKIDLENIQPEYLEEKKSDTLTEPNYIAIFDEKTKKKSFLTKNEMKIVNKNLEKSINEYNHQLKIKLAKWNRENRNIKWNFDKEKIDLRYYFRQYIISTNEDGDKIIRVFCFCSYSGDWENEIIHVHDGGDCYLNLRINLTKNKTEYFGINGLT